LRAQVYDKDPQWPGGIPEDLQLEIDLLKKLRHPHVVELFEVVLSEAHVFLVQELLSGGELFEHLLSRGACKEAEAKDIFAQVVLALDYLHELHVAHRDIKAENLVFTRRGHSQLKLIDFGTADTWTEAEGLMHCVGTPSYMAPEVVVGFYGCKGAEPTMRPYTLACDVWSIGVLLYELLSFSMPIGAPDMQSVLESVGRASENYPANLTFRPSSKWEAISDEAKNLVRCCLTSDPAARPAVSELKADRWLAPAVKHWSS
jgi:calcium-dependent protein kinase